MGSKCLENEEVTRGWNGPGRYFRKCRIFRFPSGQNGICVCNSCAAHSCLAGPAVERILSHSFTLWPNWKQLCLLKNETLILHRELQEGAPFKSEVVINMIMGPERELDWEYRNGVDTIQISCYLMRRVSVSIHLEEQRRSMHWSFEQNKHQQSVKWSWNDLSLYLWWEQGIYKYQRSSRWKSF